nr:MAG TPA: hypothetical protein [Caudoviricetes sp.]
MTRKEWIEKNLPAYINENADGGVIGCPTSYNELVRIDPSVRANKPCKGCHDMTPFVCELCWNTKLNVKEERRNNMTRKEWMLKNHPNEVFGMVRGGVVGCPGDYLDLVDIDPSTAKLRSPECGMYPECTACWNAPISQQLNDEVPMPVVGGQFWTFVRVNFSPNTDLLVVGNFVIVALMRANAEIRVVAKDETLNLEYIFFYDPEKKSIRKIPKDWALEKEYPEIDFTIYWDEESMNKAKRGIVTDREYENQYILLTKADNKKGESK